MNKTLTETKNQMRMEKKMARVYEFMINKGGSLKEEELAMFDNMRKTLSPAREELRDPKEKDNATKEDDFQHSNTFTSSFQNNQMRPLNRNASSNSVLKDKENREREAREQQKIQNEFAEMKRTIDELKQTNKVEKESHQKMVDAMSKNFETMQKSLLEANNQRLKDIQETLMNQVNEKVKSQVMDKTLAKLNENIELVSKVAVSQNQTGQNSTQFKDNEGMAKLELVVLELKNKIRDEEQDKERIRQELVTTMNKVDHVTKKENS